MTQSQQTSRAATGAHAYGPPEPEPVYQPAPTTTRWVGWVIFAGIILFTAGCFNAIAGLVALFNDDFYLVSSNGLMVRLDYTAWGWAFLVYGAIQALAGGGVIVGWTWARVVGVILAVLNALLNLTFLAAYPVWSTIVIALDVVVIYALIVHGRETRAL